MAKKIKLGEAYTDSITGFTGIAVSMHTYLYGCVRYTLERLDKDGKIQDEWFDEQRLVPVSNDTPVAPRATSGGDRPSPPAARRGR